MKRSEMLEIIKKSNDFYNEFHAWNGCPVVWEDHILTAIEAAGMLPPYNNGGLSNYDIAMGNNVNKWEPEDD